MSNGFNFNSGPVLVDDGLRRYMTFIYNKMFGALCLTGLVAWICVMNIHVLEFLINGGANGLLITTLVIGLCVAARINNITAKKAAIWFWVYSALIGASLSPLVVIYTGESIALSFFLAASFFGSMSLYGYITKKNLDGVGSFMFAGLISIIIASIVNWFFQSSVLQFGLSVLTIVVFCGLTAYDVQKIKEFYNDSYDEEILKKRAIFGALALYIDFINIFLALLRILGRKR
jgi:FtsH-binding integral membrane protein